MVTQVPSEQYYKMKAGEPYVFDDYLYSLQKKCSETMLQINSLPFGDKKGMNCSMNYLETTARTM